MYQIQKTTSLDPTRPEVLLQSSDVSLLRYALKDLTKGLEVFSELGELSLTIHYPDVTVEYRIVLLVMVPCKAGS